MALKAKVISELDKLIKLAEKEIYQFSLAKPFYDIKDLMELGINERIPNLIKLNKRVKSLKIINLGGQPVLYLQHKEDR